ncbi:MAG: serine hydrolase domain-containing protein [Minwuia sp.]|uniref:serine hydrolase domain-containing protein n=1 Tax=Minwuia sp. TaxID=2493630 RepID=UPI003A8435AA
MEKEIREAYASGELKGLHGVVVRRHGALLAEAYFDGADQRWGRDLGVRTHGPDELHDIRSVTKSVVGMLYGIALSEGIVPPIDAPVIGQFPELADLAEDPARCAITIEHALSMRMGTEWDEEMPTTDPRNTGMQMERSDDRYRFALDRRMVHRPGTVWTYGGGATELVAGIIARGAGMPIDEYARKVLFQPLGIDEWEWVRGRDGHPVAASGLRLRMPDLVVIGEMVRQGGRHAGRQVVPEDWLKRSLVPRSEIPGGQRYGYFWWLSVEGDPPGAAMGIGNGGQRLHVGLRSGVTLAVLCGNYNQCDAWVVPTRILVDIVLPAIGLASWRPRS